MDTTGLIQTGDNNPGVADTRQKESVIPEKKKHTALSETKATKEQTDLFSDTWRAMVR